MWGWKNQGLSLEQRETGKEVRKRIPVKGTGMCEESGIRELKAYLLYGTKK